MSVPLNASFHASKSVFVSLAFCHLSRISSALTLTPFSGVVKGDSRLAMSDGNGLSQSCNVFSERGRRWANCRPGCWMLSNDGVFRKSLGIQFQYLHIAKNFLQVIHKSSLWIDPPTRRVKLGDRRFYSCGDFYRS